MCFKLYMKMQAEFQQGTEQFVYLNDTLRVYTRSKPCQIKLCVGLPVLL